MHNTNTAHLTAVSLTVGNDAPPPRPTPGQFHTTLASQVKAAERGGADRVEIDSDEAPAVKPADATASRRSVVDRLDCRRQDWDERAFKAKIDAAIALARAPEPEPAPEPAPTPPRRRRGLSFKHIIEEAKRSDARSVDLPGGYRVNLTGGDDTPGAPGANPWDVVLPGAKNGSH
jgi:hypothetical protein